MTPKSRDHMPTTSLWGVAAKWPTRAPKTTLQFEPVRQDLKEYRNTVLASTCCILVGLSDGSHPYGYTDTPSAGDETRTFLIRTVETARVSAASVQHEMRELTSPGRRLCCVTLGQL